MKNRINENVWKIFHKSYKKMLDNKKISSNKENRNIRKKSHIGERNKTRNTEKTHYKGNINSNTIIGSDNIVNKPSTTNCQVQR